MDAPPPEEKDEEPDDEEVDASPPAADDAEQAAMQAAADAAKTNDEILAPARWHQGWKLSYRIETPDLDHASKWMPRLRRIHIFFCRPTA